MIWRRYAHLFIDVERIFGIEILSDEPLRIKVLLLGSRPEIIEGDAAQLLLEDAMTWLD